MSLTPLTVDEAWTSFKDIFVTIADRHAPTHTRRVRSNTLPWMTDQIRALITQRNFHHKKAQKTGSSYDWQEYRSLRNRLTVTIKETKRAYYSNLFQENKNHSSKLWSAIKSAIGSDVKASQIQSLEIDGEDITDPKKTSASFASFFKSITANLRQTLPVPAVPLCSPQLLIGAQFSCHK